MTANATLWDYTEYLKWCVCLFLFFQLTHYIYTYIYVYLYVYLLSASIHIYSNTLLRSVYF